MATKAGWFSPIEAPDGYKMIGVVEDILLTCQGLISPSRLLLSSSTSLVAGSTHIPLFFKEHRDIYHDEQSAEYPLEVLDHYPPGYFDIR